MSYAGIHWPNGPEDYEKIIALPSPLVLMLATEARYHYDAVRRAGKLVIWRAVPRVGKRPAEIGWSKAAKNADEVLNLWDEQPHYGTEWIVPYNELDLNSERGDSQDDFSDLRTRYHLLTSFLLAVVSELKRRLPTSVNVLFPPFTPDHGDLDNVDTWGPVAEQYDGLVVHAYGSPDEARKRLVWYLERFPNHPIFVGEWNSDDPAGFLKMLHDLHASYPNFNGAAYFIWHWYGAPGYWPDHYNVDRNPALYELLLDAPAPDAIKPKEPPMTRQEKIDLICRIADEYGLDRAEFLGGAFAESGHDLDQWERWGVWPDVSFGLFQQTVAYADEGDHSASPENVLLIKNLYFNAEHACRVAAVKFKYWRYNPDVPALTAWCAYNMPASYHRPESNPNIDNYRQALAAARAELGAPPAHVERTYGPEVPDEVILQQNNWSCAVRSTYGALWALAEDGKIEPVTYGDGGPRDAYDWMVPEYDTPADGLLEASGRGLVEMLGRHGIVAHAVRDATIEAVRLKAGTCPVLLGGLAWNHWVYVRGLEDDGTLILANPSPGFAGIRNELRDSYGKLGPMTMVWLEIPSPNPYQFRFGFKDKADELGRDRVGDPVEDEHPLNDRFNIQMTTKGLMIYSKAENRVDFIGG